MVAIMDTNNWASTEDNSEFLREECEAREGGHAVLLCLLSSIQATRRTLAGLPRLVANWNVSWLDSVV